MEKISYNITPLNLFFLFFFSFIIIFFPYLFFNFGFHNDFLIFEYNNKDCCLNFLEKYHLLSIGRYIQPFLQGLYLFFFDKITDLQVARLVSIFFTSINSILFFFILRKNSFSITNSIFFSFLIALIPTNQLNNGWVTNFVPGILNTTFILLSVYFFPKDLRIISPIKLLISIFLLLLTILNFPPTSGIFLLPSFLSILQANKINRENIKFCGVNVLIYIFIFFIFFIFHKFIYMKIYGYYLPESSLYHFNVSLDPINSLLNFFTKIFPVLFSFFLPTYNLFLVFILSIFLFYFFFKNNKSNFINSRNKIILLSLLFITSNSTIIFPSSETPNYIRVLQTASLFFTIFTFYNVLLFFKSKKSNLIMYFTLLFSSFSSFWFSFYIGFNLSRQLEYSKLQLYEQKPLKANKSLIFEYRPAPNFDFFGAEISPILVLNQGHVNYLSEILGYRESLKLISFIQIDKEHNYWLSKETYETLKINKNRVFNIDDDTLKLSLNGISEFIVDDKKKTNLKFDNNNIFDGIYYTFWEANFADNIKFEFEIFNKKKFNCISIVSGNHSENDRMPKEWSVEIFKNNQWTQIDSFEDNNYWNNNETRQYFLSQNLSSKKFRIIFKSIFNGSIFRIYDLKISNC